MLMQGKRNIFTCSFSITLQPNALSFAIVTMKPVNKSTARFHLTPFFFFILFMLFLFSVALSFIVYSSSASIGAPLRQQGRGQPCQKAWQPEPFSNLSDHQQRLLAVDRRLQAMASAYIEKQPFIHPRVANIVVSRISSNFTSKHVPAGPKMHSVRELATVTRQTLVDVSRPCGGGGNHGQGLLAAVFVFCQVKDFSRRRTIRETYGSALKANGSQAVLYFVVGRVASSDNASSLQSHLKLEAALHEDLLQFDFQDAYYNLTLKSLAVLRWSALHCSRAKFTFKLDTDCFIRVRPFLARLLSFPPDQSYGFNRAHLPVLRSGKWAIDAWYYPYASYPTFNPTVYLLPGQATLPLYEALVGEPTTETIPALPFEDAFVTGILAEKLCLPRATFPGLAVLFDRLVGTSDRHNVPYLKRLVVVMETLGDEDLRRIWAALGAD